MQCCNCSFASLFPWTHSPFTFETSTQTHRQSAAQVWVGVLKLYMYLIYTMADPVSYHTLLEQCVSCRDYNAQWICLEVLRQIKPSLDTSAEYQKSTKKYKTYFRLCDKNVSPVCLEYIYVKCSDLFYKTIVWSTQNRLQHHLLPGYSRGTFDSLKLPQKRRKH